MHQAVVDALRGMPPARLRLIELAWQVVREDGSLDVERASFLRQELAEALAQAEAYGQATREAVRCLRQLARS
ncbi:MAG: hypothetical protein HY687_00720 [Chloroflexi bacterium]|nr:hypothetical protein [Chloroflexota bacterium]